MLIGPPELECNFNFKVPDIETVGLFYSGGIDSTALLGLILNDLVESNRIKNVNLKIYTMYKPTGETDYSPRLLSMISNHYNIELNHINNVPNEEPHISLGRMNMKEVENIYNQHNGKIKIYMAANNMPPKSVKDFGDAGLNFVYRPVYYVGFPFLNLLKPQMIDILYKLKLDYLIPYTHSCSKQYEGRCNNCWSCTERAWGFEILGLEDPETIKL